MLTIWLRQATITVRLPNRTPTAREGTLWSHHSFFNGALPQSPFYSNPLQFPSEKLTSTCVITSTGFPFSSVGL